MHTLETAISEKKRQVERLVAEMKEANLESLAIAPADEVKNLLEGEYIEILGSGTIVYIAADKQHLLYASCCL